MSCQACPWNSEERMYSKGYAKLFERKLSISILITLVYILLCNIPMPLVVRLADDSLSKAAITSFQEQGMNVFYYVNTARMPLMILGLGPWLRAMIITQITVILLRLKNLSAGAVALISDFLAVLIGSFMAYRILNSDNLLPTANVPEIVWKTLVYIVMITAMFLVIWLADRNNRFGIGGTSLIILVNIIRNQMVQLRGSGITLTKMISYMDEHRVLTAAVIGYTLLVLVVMVFMEKTQVHLELHRALVQSISAQKSYFAVRLNPSGSMPVMFASVVYELLYLLSRTIYRYHPELRINRSIAESGTLDNPVGIIFFLAVLLMMNILFPKMMIDAEKIADSWKKSGDYIIGVRPGKATERCIKNTVTTCSVISGLVMMTLLAIPMFSSLYIKEIEGLHASVITFIILIGLILKVIEQARMMLTFKDYTTLL